MDDEERHATPSPTVMAHEGESESNTGGVVASQGEKQADGIDVAKLNDEDDAYPEGGLRAWSVVAGTWTMMVSDTYLPERNRGSLLLLTR